jgi:nicotinamidase-related amidase
MTTLENRPGTALLVVDVQVGVVADAADRDGVVANIATLVDKARTAGAPVIWVQHTSDELPSGSPQWEYVPELLPIANGEAVVHKRWGDSFEDTDLEQVLASKSIGRIVVAGAQSDACIRSTLHGAVARGYDTLLISDAHTTEDLSQWGGPAPEVAIAFTNFYWENTAAPGREIGVLTTEAAAF